MNANALANSRVCVVWMCVCLGGYECVDVGPWHVRILEKSPKWETESKTQTKTESEKDNEDEDVNEHVSVNEDVGRKPKRRRRRERI